MDDQIRSIWIQNQKSNVFCKGLDIKCTFVYLVFIVTI